MAQLMVRNLEEDVRDKLREVAQSHGESLEETVREILRRAVMGRRPSRKGLGTRMADCFSGIGIEPEITELRDQPLAPPSF
jgi:plasmid stability protein